MVQVRFELTLERVWAVCLYQLGYRTIYLKIVARDGTAPPPDDSESSILLLYERAIKTRYCRHFSGRYCFALSFQASISFPQVQTVSTANIMSLIHAGRGRRLEELPQCNYPTLLHISCRYKNVTTLLWVPFKVVLLRLELRSSPWEGDYLTVSR